MLGGDFDHGNVMVSQLSSNRAGALKDNQPHPAQFATETQVAIDGLDWVGECNRFL